LAAWDVSVQRGNAAKPLGAGVLACGEVVTLS
jgi:hypothetical protein